MLAPAPLAGSASHEAPLLSVVVPFYNEELCVRACHERLTAACEKLTVSYELVFVNDGSADATLAGLLQAREQNPHVVVVDLARNHGHQLALSAGLSVARGQRILIIDADLQDPPELLGDMMALMDGGADVVYGQRRSRQGEGWLKLVTAKCFYRLLSRVASINIPHDTGDFRLMSRQVLEVVNAMPESHRFIRGMVSWVGFNQVPLVYDRQPRYGGTTKYPFRKMVLFALDAMTSFAVAPMRFAYILAFMAAVVAAILVVWSLWAFFAYETAPGWASLMVVVLVFSSIQLFCLGIMGEYISRIFVQVKGRPLFIVKKVYEQEK
jgi:glycosyltransferase involved in cell wall biosynthesis